MAISLYITDELPRLHGKTATQKRCFSHSGTKTAVFYQSRFIKKSKLKSCFARFFVLVDFTFISLVALFLV